MYVHVHVPSTEGPNCAAHSWNALPVRMSEGAALQIASRVSGKTRGKPIPQARQGQRLSQLIMSVLALQYHTTPLIRIQKGYNVLHQVCSGPQGSVETLKWLFEVMPHLKTAETLNLGNNVIRNKNDDTS